MILRPLRIGPYQLPNNLIAAPMAGVTDRPFRELCRSLGAGLAVSEMLSANPALWSTRKSRLRRDHCGESTPIAVQIAGAEPKALAEAARMNVDHGAQIIDINMGCPAKKVCHRAAGSALLEDEILVGRILDAVVAAVTVPVTLKIRSGPDPERRNALVIAKIAEAAGVKALAIHGRTRADRFRGQAEYDTIAEVKSQITIPVIANGDIDNPEKAAKVLRTTQADGIMIGRGAQGNPWIFREIAFYLRHGRPCAPPQDVEIRTTLINHLRQLHALYGAEAGVRVARKHIGWYLQTRPQTRALRDRLMRVTSAAKQITLLDAYFGHPLDAVA